MSVQTGIMLILTSAFLHALWNGFIKRHPHKNETLFFVVLGASITALLSAPWTGGFHTGSAYGILLTVLAGLCEGGYLIALAKAFDKASLGLSYTILRGGAMLWVWMISTSFLGENLSPLAFGGVTLIGFGLFLIHPLSREDLKRREGAIWAFIGSFFIAGYHLLYGLALAEGVSQGFLFCLSMSLSLPILMTQISPRQLWERMPRSSKDISVVSLAGVLSGVSFILFLFGLPMVGPGYAITLRNTSVAWAQILGFAMGEKVSRRQIISVVLISVGAFLLS
jgi:drug/metabolite transporter (DMT)-like permease